MAELGFDLRGPASAPPLVLIPSLGTERRMWHPVTTVLAARFRVISVDLLGHGTSDVPPGPYTIGDIGQAVVALLDTLGVTRADVAGVSLGAMTGIWLAANAPERVDRLVLACTSAHMPSPGAYHDRAAEVRLHGTASIAGAVVARWFTPEFLRANPDVGRDYADMLTGCPDEGYAAACEAIATMDLRPLLRHISAPTLVLAGARDAATPPEHGRVIADAVPGARFGVLDNAAHLASVERAADVTTLIGDFLERP